jgi:predicted secreted protein with PEFG-CTERM motif
MKSKQYGALFVLLAIVAILGAASETTIMTASAQSVLPGRHCTSSQPCVQICGDHVCAPGELAQMKMQSTQTQRDINTNGTSTSTMSTPSTGVIVGGKINYMEEASDGTEVIVRTGHPISGQPLDIIVGFKDVDNNFVQHQNYAITVSQDGNAVLSNPNGHTHTGTDTQTTSALSSGNPVDITLTLNGVGLPTSDPSTWTGVKGEVFTFTHVQDVANSTEPMSNMTTPAPSDATVPEFGPVASIVLAIAVLSVVVFAAKTRVIPRL